MRWIATIVLLILAINCVNAVSVSVKTVPENPTVGEFVVRVDISSQNPIHNANLYISGLINEAMSIGDFTGETSLDFKATVERAGIYDVNVRLNYVEVVNGTPESGYVTCRKEIVVTEKPKFEILNVFGKIEPGESGSITLILVNEGGNAKNIIVNFKGMTCKDAKKFFESWRKGEKKNLTFTVFAESDASVGERRVKLEVECSDEFDRTYSFELPFSVSIVGSPKLIVSKASTNPAIIHPDSNFTLSLIVENVGKDDAKNVSVLLELPKSVEGENLAFLGDIKRGKVVSTEFELKTGNVTGNLRIPVDIKCSGGIFNSTLELYVFPYDPIHLDIAGVYTIPRKVNAGDVFTLNLAVENCGKVKARAVRVHLKLPEGLVGKDTYFLGTIESGDSATSSFDLKALKEGKYEVTAIITYLDPMFKEHEITQNFTVYVFPSENYVPLIAVVLLALVGIAVWLRRR